MKTVVIYDQLDAEIKFCVLDGDYRHLNNTYINQVVGEENSTDEAAGQAKQDELCGIMYHPETGQDNPDIIWVQEFPTEAVKEGAVVIVAGFLP